GRLWKEPYVRSLLQLLVILAAVILIYVAVLPPVFYGLVHLQHSLRIIIAVALMAPLAVLMGMPMPLAIRLISRNAPELIPWAWGVNGATSVTGSVTALLIAISSGFNQTLLIGALLYLLAVFFMARSRALEETLKDESGALPQ